MEDISAMMDGELETGALRRQFPRLSDDEVFGRWHTFHLIGDAMRGERPLSADFSDRLRGRLEHEPTVLAPRRTPGRRTVTFALSAAASLSAVALVAWVALSGPPASTPEVARAPSTPPPVIAQPVQALPVAPVIPVASVPSDGEMNEYLIAHQEFSPSTALQGLAPYIRSVSGTRVGAERR